MRRRTLLVRGGGLLCGVLATAGCTTDTLEAAERPPPPLESLGEENVAHPFRQPLATAAAGIERTAAAGIDTPDALADVIESEGLTVTDLTVPEDAGPPLLSLHSVPPETDEQGLMHHLGLVAGGYAALVASGHEGRALEATVLAPDGEPVGRYDVRRVWAAAYLDGDLTAREYAGEIGVTVASV